MPAVCCSFVNNKFGVYGLFVSDLFSLSFLSLPSSLFLEYLGERRKGSMGLKFLSFLYFFSIDETRIKTPENKSLQLSIPIFLHINLELFFFLFFF